MTIKLLSASSGVVQDISQKSDRGRGRLAIIASPLMISRKGLLPGLVAAAVALGIVAAVLITIVRGIT